MAAAIFGNSTASTRTIASIPRSGRVCASRLSTQLRNPFTSRAAAITGRVTAKKSSSALKVECATSYVGKTDYSSSNGKMGLITFGAATKKSGSSSNSRFVAIIAVALGLPFLVAAAVVAKTPAVAIAGPTASALKGTYAVTMGTVLLSYWASIQVAVGRGKYKVRPPATTGVSEDFDRIFRVQANTLEQVVMFLPALWVFALFVSPQIASVAGGVWLVGRAMYASGYYRKAVDRGAGFGIASLASNFLIAGATFGVVKNLIGA